jgi:hypothetical protein
MWVALSTGAEQMRQMASIGWMVIFARRAARLLILDCTKSHMKNLTFVRRNFSRQNQCRGP